MAPSLFQLHETIGQRLTSIGMSVLRVSREFTGCSLQSFAGSLVHRGFTTTKASLQVSQHLSGYIY